MFCLKLTFLIISDFLRMLTVARDIQFAFFTMIRSFFKFKAIKPISTYMIMTEIIIDLETFEIHIILAVKNLTKVFILVFLCRQFHNSMKMLQENSGGVFVHQKAKSTTGNLLGLNGNGNNPLGNPESYQHLSEASGESTSSSWNHATNLQYHQQGTNFISIYFYRSPRKNFC